MKIVKYLADDIFDNEPHIELKGNSEIRVDNYKGVVEYSGELIRLNLGRKTLKITGGGLDIRVIGEDNILIDGNICAIEFV